MRENESALLLGRLPERHTSGISRDKSLMSGQNSLKTRAEQTEKLTDRVEGPCLRVQLGSQQDAIDDKGRGRQ